jgi:hypothetical protein
MLLATGDNIFFLGLIALGSIAAGARFYLAAGNIYGWLFSKWIERGVAARLRPTPGAIYAALIPGPRFVAFEGFYAWDMGYVSFAPDWLTYTGERARFSVARGAVTAIDIVKTPATWGNLHGIRIATSDSVFVLVHGVLWGRRRRIRRLRARLNAWRQGEPSTQAPALAGSPLPPPDLPVFAPTKFSRGRLAFKLVATAFLFCPAIVILMPSGVTIPASLSLLPFITPLAYLLATCPLLFRRRSTT